MSEGASSATGPVKPTTNQSVDPFSQERLNRIFTLSKTHSDRIVSRESGWLEFKESFGFQSLGKYIRSAGAFANASGGYIVYGVANSPAASAMMLVRLGMGASAVVKPPLVPKPSSPTSFLPTECTEPSLKRANVNPFPAATAL